ncbi:XRE family transcriptional regulator [Mycobacteroides abscessus]|nr:hypothetical protein DDJ40_08485 [Mycobacteroides abscessus]RIU40385.1 XRE family transcriptional regulator [Mycobacteroides abscessus]
MSTRCKINHMTDATQPPEGALIQRLREQLGLSQAAAAERIGKSVSWWSQREAGYRGSGRNREPIPVSAQTLADMAGVVGASAMELRGVGRDDSAELLESGYKPATPAGGDSASMELVEKRFLDNANKVINSTAPLGVKAAVRRSVDVVAAYRKGMGERINTPTGRCEYLSEIAHASIDIMGIALPGQYEDEREALTMLAQAASDAARPLAVATDRKTKTKLRDSSVNSTQSHGW